MRTARDEALRELDTVRRWNVDSGAKFAERPAHHDSRGGMVSRRLRQLQITVSAHTRATPARRYAHDRLYGTATFRTRSDWLRGIEPLVLQHQRAPTRLVPPTLPIKLQKDAAYEHVHPLLKMKLPSESVRPRGYNPGIALAPAGLCEACRYVVTVRVDVLDQCGAFGGSRAGFRGTAVAVLDEALNTLGWTWLHTVPRVADESDRPGASKLPAGDAGRRRAFISGMRPQNRYFDARLLNLDGRLFATFACRICSFAVSLLHMHATATPQGMLFRAWLGATVRPAEAWLQGRNQALFEYVPRAGAASELMVQPWLDLVASLGAPAFSRQLRKDPYETQSLEYLHVDEIDNVWRPAAPPGRSRRRKMVTWDRAGGLQSIRRGLEFNGADVGFRRGLRTAKDCYALCQAFPSCHAFSFRRRAAEDSECSLKGVGYEEGATEGRAARSTRSGVLDARLAATRRAKVADSSAEREARERLGVALFGRADLISNHTANLWRGSTADQSTWLPRLSPTANLVRVSWPMNGGECDALLGIGHLHRGNSSDGDDWRAASHGMGVRPRNTFRFGSQYTHFWYTLQPHPPFRALASSGEFCLAAEQDASECESIQFVSGLAHSAGASLVLSYGVNDCEAKLTRLPLDQIRPMLVPVVEGGPVCEARHRHERRRQ